MSKGGGSGRAIADSFRKLFKSVPHQEKINFARHLSVTIESGLPLLDGLRLIREQAASKRFRGIIERLMKDVEGGQSLAQALARFRYIFGDFYINLVKTGEASGTLAATLKYLAEELRKQREVASRARSALIYPVVILVVTVGITVFLTLFIFPKILPIFVSLKVPLPVTTKAVIAILTFLSAYGLYLLLGLVGLTVAIRILLAVAPIHAAFDRLLLSTPFLSKLVVSTTLVNFTRSLGVLLKSGMTLVDALAVAKGTFHNLYYQAEVDRVIASVRRGEEVGRYLATRPKKFFPPMLVGMIQIGESTGKLEENLAHLAGYYEGELDELVKNLTTILEPILLVFMGIVVGFVALSIITPIYKITQEIHLK